MHTFLQFFGRGRGGRGPRTKMSIWSKKIFASTAYKKKGFKVFPRGGLFFVEEALTTVKRCLDFIKKILNNGQIIENSDPKFFHLRRTIYMH